MTAEAARVIEIETYAVAVREEAGTPEPRFRVTDIDTRTAADLRVQRADIALQTIEEKLGPRRDQANTLHKSLTGLINELSAPWKEEKTYYVAEVKAFNRKLKEERLAEQRRLEEEARRKAEEERLAQAEAAEKAGDIELAEELITEPVVVHTPVVTIEVPRVDNRKYRTVWKAQVMDKTAFILFIADMLRKAQDLMKQGRRAEAGIYAEYADALTVSDSWINSKARALGLKMSIPGLRSYET